MKRFITAAALLVCQNEVFAQPPPELYKCNADTYQCVECDPKEPAGCNFKKACEETCGHFTPEDMRGTWRGFEVKSGGPKNFTMGEVDATFTETAVTIKHADGKTEHFDVSTAEGDTFILHNDEKSMNVVNALVGNLKYTTAMGLSTYGNGTYPDSFGQAIKGNDTVSMTLFQCNKWGKNTTCDFNMTQKFMESLSQPERMISRVGDDEKCARCDKSNDKCYECECGSGADCALQADCEKNCVPHGPRYSCSWNTTNPQCVEDPKGKLSKDECTDECHAAAYGKCDYEKNTCVSCKPGADDPSCLYLMSYCKAAQEEGKCKEETLTGLFRTIETNPSFDHGEYDIEFKGGKMFIQDYTTMKEAVEVGDVKKTGEAENGGVVFEVHNWHPDPKIWPHEKMYGVYHVTYGEQQVFNFLELAIGVEPITKLEMGLKGRYFVGLNCMDPNVCDFSKAEPHPGYKWNARQQTPAREAFFLQ